MCKLHRLIYPTGAQNRNNALVIAHGLMGNAFNWNTLSTRFSKHERLRDVCGAVHALDMRNHGSSPHAPAHSCAMMAADLEHYIATEVVRPHDHLPNELDECSAHRSVLMGHSMGGVALMHALIRRANAKAYLDLYAEDQPWFPDTAALGDVVTGTGGWARFWRQNVPETMRNYPFDSTFSPVDDAPAAFEHSAAGRCRHGMVGAAVIVDIAPVPRMPKTFDQIHQDLGALLKLPLSRISSLKEANSILEELGVKNSQMRNFFLTNLKFDKNGKAALKPNVEVLRRDLYDIAIPDTVDTALQKCDLPVLFVFGENSPYFTEEARSAIPSFFSNFQIAVVPAAGHFVHHEKPNDFIESVAPFVAEHLSR